MPHRLTTFALLLVPLFGLSAGCVVAAGAVGGYVLHNEIGANSQHVAHVTFDVDDVWPTCQAVLREMTDEDVEVLSSVAPREASTRIDEREVTVTVKAFDIDRTIIEVNAKRGGLKDSHTAGLVMNQIIDRLTATRGQ